MSAARMTVGCDVEFFGVKNGNIFPFTGKIGAKKHNPKQIRDWQHLSIQEDGIAIEITFDPVLPEHISSTAASAKTELRQYLLKEFKADILTGTDEIDINGLTYPPEADVIGCESDYDGYVQPVQQRPPMTVADFNGRRFASGHIHLGTAELPLGKEVPPFIQAQFADLFIGCPLRMRSCAASYGRVNFYGKPGLYRPKPYGIEYRTPSNLWVGNTNNINLGRALVNYEQLFHMSVDELKALYKKVKWPQVRRWIEEGGNHGEHRAAWQDHMEELGFSAHVA